MDAAQIIILGKKKKKLRILLDRNSEAGPTSYPAEISASAFRVHAAHPYIIIVQQEQTEFSRLGATVNRRGLIAGIFVKPLISAIVSGKAVVSPGGVGVLLWFLFCVFCCFCFFFC